ncbi:APC family permease [Spiroplasma endosymbiont of Labia minor]|uniref:APC family permease n=1 Tax=Spiroplasma endosymbiont of Labia minor TaxID=3066305 RepID=UPI0030CAE5A5
MNNQKISFLGYIWMGFTFVAGITFTASFNVVVMMQSTADKDTGGIGLNIIWLFVVEFFVVSGAIYAYIKNIKMLPKYNGGAFQIVRTSLGRFWGFYTAILNYILFPLIVVVYLTSMFKNNFTDLVVNFQGDSQFIGSWTDLFWDLIAYFIYLGIVAFFYLGFNKYKQIVKYAIYAVWILTAVIISFAIIRIIEVGSMNLNNYTSSIKTVSYKAFSQVFTSMFFAFSGLESFIIIGNRIKNHIKSLPVGSIIIMFSTMVFYIIFTILLLTTSSVNADRNPNNNMFGDGNTFLRTSGIIIVVITTFLLRFVSILQITFINSFITQPISMQGYINEKFSYTNKKGIATKAIWLNTIITTVAIILFLILPDIIEGITKQKIGLEYLQLSQMVSFFILQMHIVVITGTFIQTFKGRLKLSFWEFSWIMISYLIIIYAWINYIINQIDNLMFIKWTNIDANWVREKLSSLMLFIGWGLLIIFVVTIYYAYYMKKIKKLSTSEIGLTQLKLLNEPFRFYTKYELDKHIKEEQKEDELDDIKKIKKVFQKKLKNN